MVEVPEIKMKAVLSFAGAAGSQTEVRSPVRNVGTGVVFSRRRSWYLCMESCTKKVVKRISPDNNRFLSCRGAGYFYGFHS
jgi:hypothetical protein